jgi:hypothetical protein
MQNIHYAASIACNGAITAAPSYKVIEELHGGRAGASGSLVLKSIWAQSKQNPSLLTGIDIKVCLL